MLTTRTPLTTPTTLTRLRHHHAHGADSHGQVRAGTTTAIVGPSGAGKTELQLRFRPTSNRNPKPSQVSPRCSSYSSASTPQPGAALFPVRFER